MKDWQRVALPTAILVLAGLGGLGLIVTAPKIESVVPEKVYPPVRVMEVSSSDIPMWVRSQGTVVPRTESDLVPEVSGPVVWVSPSLVSGGFFNEGDVLFRIDARDYEASVARARAEIARAEGEDEHARAELRRQQGLAKSKATSPSHLSNARRASRVTGAALDSARIALEQAQRDLGRTAISAPFQGRVREEHIDMGQFVGRGAPVAKLYATDFAEIRLPIADRQLAFLDLPNFRSGAQLDEGPTVILRTNFAGREHQWVGSIVRTEGEIDARSRMVHVVARVEDPYGAKAALEAPAGSEIDTRPPLAVGLFVRAEIAGPPAQNAIALPRSAIRNNQQVLVVDEGNRLFQREVEIIRIDHEEVLVRIALAEGERICTSPIQIVIDGMQVQPITEGMGHRS
ncbi:MAG: efflux RND transporter periplasmic adaptor subunit [Myxococcota bacterium]|nr:efflux RND transporter periplasmic adaptor subunit [Myxococcota bacterium]